MGGTEITQCRSLEEDIYWTHFQFLHFTQFLRHDYHQQLALPKAFSDNIKKKLPENVTLKGPGGVEWNIGVTTKDDTVYFTHGWQQFVKDNSLKENDILFFKYNGESLFEVSMFDGESFCEKASSYFVRKCGLAIAEQNGGGCSGKRRDKDKDADNFVEEINTPSNGSDEYVSPEKSTHINNTKVPLAVPLPSETPNEKNLNIGVESASPEQIKDDVVTKAEPVVTPTTEPAADPVPFRSTGKRIRRPVYAVNNTVPKKRKGRPTKAYSSLNRLAEAEPTSVGKSEEPTSVGKSEARGMYTSNRRPVTDIEIQTTLQLAQAACPAEGLHIVMRPTHVYKRFFVALPNTWILNLLSRTSQDVILRAAKGEWLAKYSYQSYRDTGGLTGGWKLFAVDNNLEEFDVCVFKPGGHMNKTLILDVSIFRVVEKITPLTGVKSPKKSSGKWRGIGRHGKNATDTVETETESIGVTKAKPVSFRSPTSSTRTTRAVYKRRGRPAKGSTSRAGELIWVTDNKAKAVDDRDSSDMVVEAKWDPSALAAKKDIISK